MALLRCDDGNYPRAAPLIHLRDRQLVRRMVAGDSQAFDRFFDQYSERLFRFAVVRLGYDESGAAEVVQESLLKIIRKLATYRGEAPLFSWCCTFCRHEISRYQRRRPAVVASLDEDTPEIRAVLETLATIGCERPDEVALRREIARLVQVTLDHLPPRYDSALRWKYLEGESVKTIARRLEVSPKAAESVLTRARSAFREGFSSLGGKVVARLATVEEGVSR